MTTFLAMFHIPMPLVWLLFIVVMIFALWAQYRVSSAYNKNVQIPSRGRISGREAAEAVMHSAGIDDVEIVEIEGHLTDHYDPSQKQLALSSENYHGSSLAALGVAAHEAGHAIQHKTGYAMLHARMAMIPAMRVAAPIAMFVTSGGIFLLALLGMYTLGMLAIQLGVIALSVIALFQLITLPVEFDATRRAKLALVNLGILDQDEMQGVHETLDAAALTYVAALATTMVQLLQLLSILSGNRRDD